MADRGWHRSSPGSVGDLNRVRWVFEMDWSDGDAGADRPELMVLCRNATHGLVNNAKPRSSEASGVVLSAASKVNRRARSAAMVIMPVSLPGDGNTNEPSVAGAAIGRFGAHGRSKSSSGIPNMACSARRVAGIAPPVPRSPRAMRAR